MKRLLVAVVSFAVSPAFAGAFISSSAIPTLDDVGLGALTLVLAVAGAVAIRRHRKK